ncbi:hypothetical protein TruAng_002147 [Truncatella angustata]|nr:hypothetical protein TruAng_002147 [Truncatella angustata]
MADNIKLQVAVIGAGIAGLAAAIALKSHPAVDVQIYERAAELREIGASIALGPNGMRTLDRLGVHNALEDTIAFRNKSRFPMIYRSKLVVSFADGSTANADIVLGADGIHSRVRTQFVPSSRTAWTGWVTFRSVFPVAHLSHIHDVPDEAVHIWGPDRTLFLSHLGKDLFTVVGSEQSDPSAPDAPYKDATWNSDGDVNVLKEYYKDWSPSVRAIVDAVPYTRIYPNSTAHALDTWILGEGRVTLAGDAAHAHGGAFAAGGSLALDDAWAFAASIFQIFPPTSTHAPKGQAIADALALYERTRKPHTDRVMQVVAQGNAKKVEQTRTKDVITDEQLRKRMKERADTSWIHEHDVVSKFRETLAAGSKTEEHQARL